MSMFNDPRLPERFWVKVTQSAAGCWLWTASNSNGYGLFSLGGRLCPAHRVSYSALVGPISAGLQLDHLCRTPACVNPEHLEPVTPRVNTLRGRTLPAANAAKTSCPQGHAYDAENTYMTSAGTRQCKECTRTRSRLNQRRRRAEARVTS